MLRSTAAQRGYSVSVGERTNMVFTAGRSAGVALGFLLHYSVCTVPYVLCWVGAFGCCGCSLRMYQGDINLKFKARCTIPPLQSRESVLCFVWRYFILSVDYRSIGKDNGNGYGKTFRI